MPHIIRHGQGMSVFYGACFVCSVDPFDGSKSFAGFLDDPQNLPVVRLQSLKRQRNTTVCNCTKVKNTLCKDISRSTIASCRTKSTADGMGLNFQCATPCSNSYWPIPAVLARKCLPAQHAPEIHQQSLSLFDTLTDSSWHQMIQKRGNLES